MSFGMRLTKTWQKARTNWHLPLVILGAILLTSFLYLRQLGALTHGLLSAQEAAAYQNYHHFQGLLNDPINAPFRLLDTTLMHLHSHSASYARLGSVIVAVLACALMYIIVYRWHGRRAAIFTTLLFGTSSWMLHTGRSATATALFTVVPLGFIVLASWLNSTERYSLAVLSFALVLGILLFVPGAVWFLLAGGILLRGQMVRHVRDAKLWAKIIGFLLPLGVLVLLGLAFYSSPHLIRNWLDIPQTLPQPLTMLKQWASVPLYLFVHGPFGPAAWLGRTPIFDAFTSSMCLFGVYFYARHYKNSRTQVLGIFLLIGSVLVALNGLPSMSFIVPMAYLLAGTGITFFLHEWLKVFPRNPLARGLGIGLIALAVACTILYHYTHYFVAWPQNPETLSLFTQSI